MVALRNVWAVMDAPAGKRMTPFLVEIVGRLRARGELDLDDATAAMLCAMSAATIDRRLPGERKQLEVRGRSGTKPGSLLKSQMPIDHRNKDVRQRTLMPHFARSSRRTALAVRCSQRDPLSVSVHQPLGLSLITVAVPDWSRLDVFLRRSCRWLTPFICRG
jgi:hypothetical protein